MDSIWSDAIGGFNAFLGEQKNAVGRTILDVDSRKIKEKEEDRPENVVAAILTDGMENASKEFTRDQIKVMIEKQQSERGWDFVFLAANQDAFQEAGHMGISIYMAANFNVDRDGTKDAFQTMSDLVADSRLARPRKKGSKEGLS